MIEIRCLNYQLCHLSPHVVTYLTPKNADNKNIHHLVAFLPWPQLVTARLFLYKPHTIVVDNGNIWGWIPFNETFQVILVRGDVCKLKISLSRAWQGRNPRKFLVTQKVRLMFMTTCLCPVFWLVTVTWTFLWRISSYDIIILGLGGVACSFGHHNKCAMKHSQEPWHSNGRLDDVCIWSNHNNLSLILESRSRTKKRTCIRLYIKQKHLEISGTSMTS